MNGLLATTGSLTFMRPAALWALAGVALPALLAWRARRRGRRVPLASVIVQSLALAAVAVCLADPLAALGGRAKLPYLLAVDASGSVRRQRPGPDELQFPPGAEVSRFSFAAGLGRADQAADESATRVGAVLRMIGSRARTGLAAAVIVTDGRFTDADWPGAAAAVAGRGADVLIIPMDSPPPDARIASVTAVRRGRRRVEIAATVSAGAPMQRTLTITRAGAAEPLLVRPLALLGRGPVTVRATDTLAEDATGEYAARLDADDAFGENDSATLLLGPLRRSIAVVAAPPDVRQTLSSDLPAARFLAADELAATPAGLAELSGVIIFDATGTALSASQRTALAEYVRAGGGLVMVGTGPHARPADDRDPLNRVLPLAANPFHRRPLHLSVLLDRSGSMKQPAGGGATRQIKFDLAAEAVVALTDHLTNRDALTVIMFSDRAAVEYDSGDRGADFAALRRKLASVVPGGSTKVIPAMERALSIRRAGGRTPMLLILSDLRTEDFDPAAWADRLRRAGAKLAVVAIREAPEQSPPAEPPLKALAEQLGAAYEQRDHLAGLAEVFARLVRRGRGDALKRERTRIVVTAPVFDTGLAALPQAKAYILSGLRGRSELLARTPGGDPILAFRRAGLGRTVSLAVPLSETLNPAWARDPAATGLISSAVNWAAKGDNDPRLDVNVTREGGALRITVTARDYGLPLTDMDLTAAVAARGEITTAPLLQVKPGRYEASAACPPDATAAIEIRDRQDATIWHGSAAAFYPPEYRSLGADMQSLRRLAHATGGRIVPAGALAESLRQVHRRRMTILWPYLLAVALAAMLVEWSLTRITRQ